MTLRYREAGRTYLTTLILLGLFVIGFVLDVSLGGGVAHIIGWIIAIVLVVGAEALTVYAARAMRSIAVTEDEIRVGEEALARSEVASADHGGDAEDRVLGRKYATGLPRGTQGVALALRDGSRVVIATRHPDELLAALEFEPAPPPVVRVASEDELPALTEIADRADSLFRVAGYELPVFDPDPDRRPTKIVLVIGEPAIGFAEFAEADGAAYLAELAVLPGQMRRGFGSALVQAGVEWAREQGYSSMTLTTYRDIAWNAPFYRGLGFADVTSYGPELQEVRAHEGEVGLDAVGPRIVMSKQL